MLCMISAVFGKSSYPFDLDIAAPVQEAYSDEQSSAFMTNQLPSIESLINTNVKEKKSLNPDNLSFDSPKFDSDYSVRIYFISEGADWRNTLGYSTTGGSPLDDSAKLIFPNSSTSSAPIRTPAAPLKKGDFVDLGKFEYYKQLDFFLIAKGFDNGKSWYSTTDSFNSDGIKHAVNFGKNSIYTIVGFEDILGGGDKDYNDVIIGLEFRKLAAPEVANTILLGFVGMFVGYRRRI